MAIPSFFAKVLGKKAAASGSPGYCTFSNVKLSQKKERHKLLKSLFFILEE